MRRYSTEPAAAAPAHVAVTRTTDHISTHLENIDLPRGRALRQRLANAAHALTDPVTRLLARRGVSPNLLTVTGLVGACGTCVLILRREWVGAGFVFTLGSVMDLLDGPVARISGRSSDFGAFLDSTFDRIAEGLVLGAIGVTLAQDRAWWALGASFAALTSSFLVSYTRARAEGLGLESNRGGLMSRPERLVLTGAGIFFAPIDPVLKVVVFVLAGLTMLTVIQRVFHVWRALRARPPSHKEIPKS